MTILHRMARWACNVTLDDVPPRVREQAVHQWLSTLAAIYTGYDSDLGPSIAEAFPPPGPGAARIIPTSESAPPAHAAMLMAAWSMVLDFDDVMLGGHTGHSSVIVPLALAGGRSGAELLLAQIVANEIAARINMVCAVGSTRGQMATHLHLIAAAAARARLEGLDETQFAAALAFALSYPGQALYPAFLGSDAKVLCAALPVRAGMEAVDAVRAGLRAPSDPLDDPRGFFAKATRIPVRDFLDGLGERRRTVTSSIPFAAISRPPSTPRSTSSANTTCYRLKSPPWMSSRRSSPSGWMRTPRRISTAQARASRRLRFPPRSSSPRRSWRANSPPPS